MSTKLNLEDRYYLSMYSRKLPCTVHLRFNIDTFLDQIEITSAEAEQYNVTVDLDAGTFTCSDENYTVEYERFPPAVVEAMKHYVKLLDVEDNKNNVMLQKIFTFFKKII